MNMSELTTPTMISNAFAERFSKPQSVNSHCAIRFWSAPLRPSQTL